MIALGRVWDPRGAVVGRSSVARDRGRENSTNQNWDCIAAGVHVPSPVNLPYFGQGQRAANRAPCFGICVLPSQHTKRRATAVAGVNVGFLWVAPGSPRSRTTKPTRAGEALCCGSDLGSSEVQLHPRTGPTPHCLPRAREHGRARQRVLRRSAGCGELGVRWV